MDRYRKHFGNSLRKHLYRAGLKQTELAEKLKISAPSVSRWVSGDDFPSDDKVAEIASALKVSLFDLYNLPQETPPIKEKRSGGTVKIPKRWIPDVIELFARLPDLSPQELDLVRLIVLKDDSYAAGLTLADLPKSVAAIAKVRKR